MKREKPLARSLLVKEGVMTLVSESQSHHIARVCILPITPHPTRHGEELVASPSSTPCPHLSSILLNEKRFLILTAISEKIDLFPLSQLVDLPLSW